MRRELKLDGANTVVGAEHTACTYRFLTQQTALKKIFERVFLGKRKNRFVQEN